MRPSSHPGSTATLAPSPAVGCARRLASYYARHMVLAEGVAYAWEGGRAEPRSQMPGVVQVGVAQDRFFALRADGELVAWGEPPVAPRAVAVLAGGVAAFAAGQSGWFAIDAEGALSYSSASAPTAAPVPVATQVLDACIGDSADYYITRDGALFVKGLAHRGQYGDGRLTASAGFISTASDAVAVRAHTGHAIYLARDGTVFGTGGNRFGPLSTHGLGDKADRWGPIFEGAVAIATGSRHSAALRADGGLWVWGEGFAIAPRLLFDGVADVAAGDTATIALRRDGSLWQWERGVGPRRLALR